MHRIINEALKLAEDESGQESCEEPVFKLKSLTRDLTHDNTTEKLAKGSKKPPATSLRAHAQETSFRDSQGRRGMRETSYTQGKDSDAN